MSKDTVKLITGIIKGTLRKGHSVPLHQLLWTVDAQLRLIVSAEEINEALQRVPPVRIKRRGGRVELLPCAGKAKAKVTAADIERAAAIYNDYMSDWVSELVAKRSVRKSK